VSECAGNFGNWKECVEKVQSNQELTMERSVDESGKKIILVKDEAGNVLFRISGAQDY